MREISKKRAGMIKGDLEAFALRYGSRLYFDHNIETGELHVLAVRPDEAMRRFKFKSYYRETARIVRLVKQFLMPF